MAILTILTEPDPRLRKIADPISSITPEIRKLMDDMIETMYANDGLGLAATQVGVLKRVIVMDLNAGEENLPPHIYKMANPEIIWSSDEMSILNEACLSVPAQRAPVERPVAIKVRYIDENNMTQELDAEGLLATCIQHEIDHLNGTLFIDYLSRLKRDMILTKLTKLKKFRVN